MLKTLRKSVVVFLLLFASHAGKAQELTVNTNLLYDATSSMNAGIEFKTGKNFTFKFPLAYNPWEFEDNRKVKFILAQPEFRWWMCEPFYGHFFGLHAHGAYYNVGATGTNYMKDYRFEGYLYGAGITYGYQFYLAPRWNLEASVGAGYALLKYDQYECQNCGKRVMSGNKAYLGPTQIGISLIYIIK
ncbi:MAG: DUF3575 domain-containing protein [Dysgonamonadaceae bacterium]|nr:DUF3575 domain-containing protein [Dysgonamonadaceae bacterium]